jgi:hypothetical protein
VFRVNTDSTGTTNCTHSTSSLPCTHSTRHKHSIHTHTHHLLCSHYSFYTRKFHYSHYRLYTLYTHTTHFYTLSTLPTQCEAPLRSLHSLYFAILRDTSLSDALLYLLRSLHTFSRLHLNSTFFYTLYTPLHTVSTLRYTSPLSLHFLDPLHYLRVAVLFYMLYTFYTHYTSLHSPTRLFIPLQSLHSAFCTFSTLPTCRVTCLHSLQSLHVAILHYTLFALYTLPCPSNFAIVLYIPWTPTLQVSIPTLSRLSTHFTPFIHPPHPTHFTHSWPHSRHSPHCICTHCTRCTHCTYTL